MASASPSALSRQLPAPVLAFEKRAARYLGRKQLGFVHRAYLYADECHTGQKRRSGEPYIFHPVAVADILVDMRMDQTTIAAALMHDVIEDTPATFESVSKLFGEATAKLVEGVTKLDKLEFSSREEAQAESFRKMLLAMSRDMRVILIKLADRLHNMRTLQFMSPPSQRRIARETLDIYAPIAQRLGMRGVKQELQDLSFAAISPWRHAVLQARLRSAHTRKRDAMLNISNEISARMKSSKIDCVVTSRIKSAYSVYRKMLEKDRSFEEITDIFGFRLVVPDVTACYQTLGVVHNLYKPDVSGFKDYIAIPKANGYQSLHTVLFGPYQDKIEVQIRSRAMDKTAERGIAAHWSYKAKSDGELSTGRARKWLLGLLDLQRKAGDSIEFLEHVKIDLFPDDQYVFTRDGEIFTLPRNSTALDFAYTVHTDVGNRAVRARIDGLIQPLRTPLKSGQKVEIITAPSAKPHPDWLEFVVTSRARSAIRHYLKGMQYEDAVDLGHRMLDKALAERGTTLEQFDDAQIQRVLREYAHKRLEELLAEIALGSRVPSLVARQFLAGRQGDENTGISTEQALQISGQDSQVVTFPHCCHPIPGDAILGYLSAGKGLVLHRRNCHNVPGLKKNPDRLVEVEWAPNCKGEFTVTLRVETRNRRGVLAAISAAISASGSNIEHIEYAQRDGEVATLMFMITVTDRNHLARVMRRVRLENDVTRVDRATL